MPSRSHGVLTGRNISACCAVAVPAGDLDPDELIRFAAERLSGPKRPKRVVIVDELPKTGTGKVLKRDLRTRIGG